MTRTLPRIVALAAIFAIALIAFRSPVELDSAHGAPAAIGVPGGTPGSITSLGFPCAHGANNPTISYQNSPVQVNTVNFFEVSDFLPFEQVAFVVSGPVASPVVFGGCQFWLDVPNAGILFESPMDAAGNLSVFFPLPDQPSLIGFQYNVQAIGTLTPSGVSASNTLSVTIGEEPSLAQ